MSFHLVDGNLSQISLGKVEVLKKDGVSLKDVDPENIPANIDIIVQPREKEVLLIGRRVHSDPIDSRNFTGKGELQELSKEGSFIHTVQSQFFHEQSYQEFTDNENFFFDPVLSVTSWKDDIAGAIRKLPVFTFLVCLILAADEVYRSRNNHTLLEIQEMKALEQMKNSLLQNKQRQLLFDDN